MVLKLKIKIKVGYALQSTIKFCYDKRISVFKISAEIKHWLGCVVWGCPIMDEDNCP